jgi:type II secretory ATPase GspE/PulE/Tfp pilus assembly ATPase PilB-like protein
MKEKFDIEVDENDNNSLNELLNLIIEDACSDRASDIHLNPAKQGLKIRYRVDGSLRDISTLSPLLNDPLVKKIKERASLNIDISLKPQDGKINYEFGNKYLDIRVSTLPSFYGENIVMRILDKSTITLDLENLGFSGENLKKYRDLLNCPYGLIIINGPTGCGKTTTAYAGLKEMANPGINILTVEDPVEYLIDNVIHTQINTKEGITFPVTLRSLLRQDPDVVYCGEIRDDESAKLLLETALTGHVVISILHAMDSAEALSRLMDIGLEPFLLASALRGIISQRLIRKICPHCKEEISIAENLVNILKEENLYRENMVFYRGKGCQVCVNTGYRGRTALHEVVVMNDELKNEISSKPSCADLAKCFRSRAIASMKHDGLKKAIKGITTIDEVLRICSDIKW